MPKSKTGNEQEKVKKTPPGHVVVFQNEDGAVLKTSFVLHGQAAQPPKLPEHTREEEHYYIVFDGWDQDYANVTGSRIIKPVWRREPKKYLVMYFHENGTMLGMESVSYGSPATQPYHPEKDSDDEYDYPFIGWNCELSHIEGDTNAKAVFGKVRKIFTVRFYHEDGTLLKEEKVHYGESAHPPAEVTKLPDEIYHYQFETWSYPTDYIRSSLNIYAVFKYIYNKYSITFYEEDKVYSRIELHYGDEIIYPELSRKGYDLIWDKKSDIVTGDEEIHASWRFSNPVNKIIRNSQGVFRILNPSIHSGTVCCLKFFTKGERKVFVPSVIRIGDYYYQIAEMGPYALRSCSNLETLILPDSLRVIQDRGLAGCRNLKKVIFGKKITSLGKGIFADDMRLQNVELPGRELKFAGKGVFSRAPRRLAVTQKYGGTIF